MASGSVVPRKGARSAIRATMTRAPSATTTGPLLSVRSNSGRDDARQDSSWASSSPPAGARSAERSGSVAFAMFTWSASLAEASVANARIKHRIEHVHEEVDDDVGEREQQDQPLDDRIVAREHRFDYQPAEAGQVKHRFCHDDAADQVSDSDADNGDDRNRG